MLDPLCGIVIGVRTLPLDPGSPSVWNATVQMSDTTPYLGHQCHQNNGGAGLTEEIAWSAALGEAMERYCVAVVDPRRLRFGDAAEVARTGATPLLPHEIALFAEHQRESLPRPPYGEASRLAWLEGVSLLDQRARLVPACLIHIPYHPVFRGEDVVGPAISTGLACAPSDALAIRSGLYECIERDVFSIVWLNRLVVPRLELDEPELRRVFEERFARPGLEYFVFLLRLDFSAPSVLVLIRDRNFDPAILCVGGACRMDVRDAALKALVEAVQGWTWARHERIEVGRRETPTRFDDIQSFDARVRLYACAEMSEAVSFLLDASDRVRVSDLPREDGRPAAVIPALLDELRRAGTDVVALDLTTPDVAGSGLRVIKTYTPFLQQIEGDHRYRLLGGTRWRDVPVRLGLRAEPIRPDELPRFPHPYP